MITMDLHRQSYDRIPDGKEVDLFTRSDQSSKSVLEGKPVPWETEGCL